MSTINDSAFNSWLNKVNQQIYSVIKINIYDLPDNTFRLDFDKGTHYKIMAEKVIKDTEWEDYYYSNLD